MPEVKFCGLTRPEDARHAASLGAHYAGVILAGGPRNLSIDRAREVLDSAGGTVKRVAVFGKRSPDEIAAIASDLELDIAQLHGDPTPTDVVAVRQGFRGGIWPVCRVRESGLPVTVLSLAREADAILLDRYSPRDLGGTGETLPWRELSGAVDAVRELAILVLAGGLTPENVTEAISLVRPNVVDVSSGVESAPGVKDHDRMTAFLRAVITCEER